MPAQGHKGALRGPCNVASGWEKGVVEKNVQDSCRRIWIDAARLRFGAFVELNAWIADRCRSLWAEVRHPEHGQFSVAEMLEHERSHLMLMPMPEPFDGYVEKPARVSCTCLVSGARNRYSVPCELAGQMVSTRLYPDSVVAVGHNSFAARHERPSDAGQTRYDWQYYWRKMYHKTGLVLRIETVIKNPNEFRVRKQVLRHGKQRTEWVQLRKGVVYLLRYREVSLQANPRYLDALAAVDDPTQGKQALRRLTDHREEGCRGPLLPGRQPDGATRRKSVQEPDGRPALPARIHQPRHPFTADEDALAALVRQ